MTSNATPSGFVYASSFRNAGEEPWRAFDQNTSTSWISNTTNTATLTYQFPTGRNIKRYAFRTSTAANAPRQWSIEGSNDNITFTVLDTVTASLAASAVYTSTILANTASFTFYRHNITAVGAAGTQVAVMELELTESTGSGAGNLSGGSFNFNSGSISASVASGINAGATNLITVTAATGTVNISAPNTTFFAVVTGQIVTHSGNCNLIITGSSFTAGGASMNVITKTSTGTLTVLGNLVGGSTSGTNYALSSNAGNTIIVGNIAGALTLANGSAALVQTAGSLTVTGNVTGGIGTTTTAGIAFSGTSLTVTGSITGGSGATPAAGIIITSTPTINISGSVNGASAVGISSTTANTTNIIGNIIGSSAAAGISYTGASILNITGSLIAGTGANAVSSTSTSATNIIRGNLINTNGIMAFYGPDLQLASGNLTTWQFTSSTGTDRTLYTLDQIGDQPSPSNVRTGTSYAGGSLTGTMVIPPTASVALGVPVDNTTGSAVLNPTYVADEIWNQPTSTLTVPGSIGERIKNTATVQSTGAQIAALAGGN
jgi:hypothetical protein